MIPALTPEHVIENGGWNTKYAKVLRLSQLKDAAVALVDVNGNGAEIYCEVWCWDEEDGWSFASGSGCGTFTGDGDWGEHGGSNMGIAFLAGEERGTGVVTVGYADEVHQVPVGEDGIWLFVTELQSSDLLQGAFRIS